jgi:hypothetical protein
LCGDIMNPLWWLRASGDNLRKGKLSLIDSIIPEFGDTTPTFTRATAATEIDFEGLVKTIKVGAVRFRGSRYVENVLSGYTEDFSNVIWQKLATATVTGTNQLNFPAVGDTVRQISLSAKNGDKAVASIKLYGSGSLSLKLYSPTLGTIADLNITLTSSYVRYSVDADITQDIADLRYIIIRDTGDTATTVFANEAQLECAAGQANQAPSEYVGLDVLSSPFYGAGVDGVQWSRYENGNTVDGSGIVTEAQGDRIDADTTEGYHAELAATNLAKYSRDFSQADWAASNITPTANSVAGPDGRTKASLLAATAGNGTILQTSTQSIADFVAGFYLKRKTGTGDIDITVDGGTTWETKVITSEWVRYEVTYKNVANPQFGVRIVTSGDEIYVDFAQCEAGEILSSAIETAAVTVTRNSDLLSYDNTDNAFFPTSFTIFAGVTPDASGANYADTNVRIIGSAPGGTDALYTEGDTEYNYAALVGGGQFGVDTGDVSADTLAKYGLALVQVDTESRSIIYRNAVSELDSNQSQTLNHSYTSLKILNYSAASVFNARIKNVSIYEGLMPSSVFIRETTLPILAFLFYVVESSQYLPFFM